MAYCGNVVLAVWFEESECRKALDHLLASLGTTSRLKASDQTLVSTNSVTCGNARLCGRKTGPTPDFPSDRVRAFAGAVR